jgi:RNA polymerase sigma-70 factor (ECF subfamily)
LVEPSDSEVLTDSLAGRPEAFADIVRRHSNAVHGYLARRAGRETADELLGEVWLRAFRSRHTYDGRFPNARPWLYGIARNTLRAHWRLDRLDGAREAELVDDPWQDADARLDALQQGPALRDALSTLDAEDREVLLLIAWERLTQAEVAISLGMPSGTVRWRLHRARKQLQNRLDGSSACRPLDARSKEV